MRSTCGLVHPTAGRSSAGNREAGPNVRGTGHRGAGRAPLHRWLPIIVALGVALGLPRAPLAQEVLREISVDREGGSANLRIERADLREARAPSEADEAEEERTPELVIRRENRGRRLLLRTGLPGFLFDDDRVPELEARWRVAAGDSPFLEVTFHLSDGEDGVVYVMLLGRRSGRHDPSTAFRLVWSGRRSDTGFGEHLEIRDLDGDGRDELVVHSRDPDLQFCGGTDVLLAPRVYDPRRERFRPVSVRPSVPADARVLEPSTDPTRDHFRDDARFTHVSSDGDSPLYLSYGPAPARLADGDSSTAWREGAPGSGVGQFLVGDVLPETALIGIQLTGPPESLAPTPSRLLLGVEDGSTYLLSMPDRGPHTFLLPADEVTSCVSLAILDVPPGAETAGLAEARPLTQLDERPLERALNLYLVPLLLEHRNQPRAPHIARMIASAGPEVAPILYERMLDTFGPEQSSLVAPIALLPNAPEWIRRMLAESDLHPDTLAAIGRTLIHVDLDAGPLLVESLGDAQTWERRYQIMRILARIDSDATGPELIRWVGRGPHSFRSELVRLLGDLPRSEVDHVILGLTLSDDPAAHTDLLRAIYRLSRALDDERVSLGLDAAQVLRQQVDRDLVTTRHADTQYRTDAQRRARLGVESMASFGDPQLLEYLLGLTDASSESVRAIAVDALGRFDGARAPLDDRAGSRLRDALDDENPTVRLAAATAIRRRGATPRDDEALFARLATETWPEIRRTVIVALAASARADARLARALADQGVEGVQTVLSVFATRTEPPELRPLLMLEDTATQSRSAHAALGRSMARLSDPEAVDWLLDAAGSTAYPELAADLIEAVGRQRSERGLALVRELLDAEDRRTRRAAARAISYYRNADALRAVEARLETEADPDVVRALRNARIAIERNRSF